MSDLHPPPRRRGRPPQGSLATQDTRGELLRAGLALLTEKGYSSVGLDEVLRSAGLTKGSFYHCFDSKEAFGLALVEAYAAYFAAKLDRHFNAADRAPLQRLRDFIDDACAGMARHGYRRGCLVGNLGQEMGALPEAFRERLEGVFQDWQARTADCLAAAQAAGELGPAHDPQALAHLFWLGWEGAVLRAKLVRSDAPLRAYANGFFLLLGRPGLAAPM